MIYRNAKYFLSLIFMLVIFLQNICSQDLDFYELHFDKGKEYYQDSLYGDAISEFILAKNYISSNDKARMNIINGEISKTRDAIKWLLNETKEAKEKAQAENQKTKLAKAELERTLANKQKIVSSFYFYNDQLALAYKNNRYGFINKEGDVMIDYIFEEARPFDYTGLSKASHNGTAYLVEDNGEKYKLAKEISQLDSTHRALDVSNKGYVEFPEDILKFNKLEIIKLNNNQLRDIPVSIAKFFLLRRLYVYNNRLEKLPDEIGSLSGLVLLDLSNNKIHEIPGTTGNLSKLSELIVYDNNLHHLPEDIGNLTNLRFLDASKNLFEDLPDEMGRMEGLRILALGENQFKQFPSALEHLSQLLMLDMSNNYIGHIPSWIGKMEALTNLYVNNNQLETFPDQIVKLHHLRMLVAGNNMISTLPANMGSLQNLEELILPGNQLTSIPYEIGRLDNLRKLDVRKNPGLDPEELLGVFVNAHKQIYITAGDPETDFLNDRGALLIRIDPFHSLPETVKYLKTLQILELNNCTQISAQDIWEAFNDHPGKIMYTNTLNPELADTNEMMISIELERVLVPLSKIASDPSRKFVIDLSDQDIKEIPDYVFSIENLVSLDLRDNQLTGIPDKLYQLTDLKNLYLHNNDLSQEDVDRIRESMPYCEVHY